MASTITQTIEIQRETSLHLTLQMRMAKLQNTVRILVEQMQKSELFDGEMLDEWLADFQLADLATEKGKDHAAFDLKILILECIYPKLKLEQAALFEPFADLAEEALELALPVGQDVEAFIKKKEVGLLEGTLFLCARNATVTTYKQMNGLALNLAKKANQFRIESFNKEKERLEKANEEGRATANAVLAKSDHFTDRVSGLIDQQIAQAKEIAQLGKSMERDRQRLGEI